MYTNSKAWQRTVMKAYLDIEGCMALKAEPIKYKFLENIDITKSTFFKISIGKVPEYGAEDKWPTYYSITNAANKKNNPFGRQGYCHNIHCSSISDET